MIHIYTLTLLSVFVFKLHFSSNRVYKPCLERGDHFVPISLEFKHRDALFHKDGSAAVSIRVSEILPGILANCSFIIGLRLLDIGDGDMRRVWVFLALSLS